MQLLAFLVVQDVLYLENTSCSCWIFAASDYSVISDALLQVSNLTKIGVFLSHYVEMLLVLHAALGFSCSTRCPLPRKHQLQLSPPRLGGVIWQPTVNPVGTKQRYMQW